MCYTHSMNGLRKVLISSLILLPFAAQADEPSEMSLSVIYGSEYANKQLISVTLTCAARAGIIAETDIEPNNEPFKLYYSAQQVELACGSEDALLSISLEQARHSSA